MECSQQVIGHRGLWRTHDKGPSVVLAVLVVVEDVHDGGHEGVEEGEDRYGDEELGRGGVVSREEKALTPHFFAQRGFKGHLVQPDTHRGGPGGRGQAVSTPPYVIGIQTQSGYLDMDYLYRLKVQ